LTERSRDGDGRREKVTFPKDKGECLTLIGKEQYLSPVEGLSTYEAFQILTAKDPWRCKKCSLGLMKAYPLNNSA
jgi:hypothetical protein